MKKEESKQLLLDNLKNGTFCRVQPSKLGGVGVFAIRSIPKGVSPFNTAIYPEDTTSADITPEEMGSLHPNIRRIITDFFMQNEDGNYPVICNGLNAMNISYYLNHSDNPNLKMIDSGENYYSFVTSRRIAEGEELTINYFEHCRTPEAKNYICSQFRLNEEMDKESIHK